MPKKMQWPTLTLALCEMNYLGINNSVDIHPSL
ncbi:hypothetical protein THIARS_70594 [Thiomonas delicata]|uniref:Uncharacterized protein n=1 Tax=Thiomonas delicata TaxID=364030 RepID=A0A238D751_THIDL|nr:hypothetical protein THIARS_70594 [Thiomonas delicata]